MDRLATSLRDAMVATDLCRRAGSEAMGLALPEASAMIDLWVRGPLTPSELVERVGLTSPSVTSLLDRLEQGGLVTRRRNPKDRRSVLIQLTPEGAALASAPYRLWSGDLAGAVRDFAPEHVDELTAMLDKITAVLISRANDRQSWTAAIEQAAAAPVPTAAPPVSR